jgi:hypothetical protein
LELTRFARGSTALGGVRRRFARFDGDRGGD